VLRKRHPSINSERCGFSDKKLFVQLLKYGVVQQYGAATWRTKI